MIMGMNVAYFDVDNLEDYLRVLKICTDITGCADNYKKNGINAEKHRRSQKKSGRLETDCIVYPCDRQQL